MSTTSPRIVYAGICSHFCRTDMDWMCKERRIPQARLSILWLRNMRNVRYEHGPGTFNRGGGGYSPACLSTARM
jgi:hypothetical protein